LCRVRKVMMQYEKREGERRGKRGGYL